MYLLEMMLLSGVVLNINLMIFNMIPIPPFDGSRILYVFLPTELYFKVMRYERYIMIGLFVLLWTGILTKPLSWLADIISSGFSYITQLPFEMMGLL